MLQTWDWCHLSCEYSRIELLQYMFILVAKQPVWTCIVLVSIHSCVVCEAHNTWMYWNIVSVVTILSWVRSTQLRIVTCYHSCSAALLLNMNDNLYQYMYWYNVVWLYQTTLLHSFTVECFALNSEWMYWLIPTAAKLQLEWVNSINPTAAKLQ